MAAQANAPKRAGMVKFFKSVKAELKKVSWPNKKELQSYTWVVLVTCVVASLGIWIADSIFSQAIKLLVK